MSLKYLNSILIVIVVSICNVKFAHSVDNNAALLSQFTWECANNASCVNSMANSVLSRFSKKQSINFGLFSIDPIPEKNVVAGRASGFLSFLDGNALRIPFGPFAFTAQRSDDYDNYIELAVARRSFEEGRENRRHGKREKKHIQILIPMFLAANAMGWTMLAVKAVGVLTIKALLISKLAFIVAAGIILKKLMESANEKMMYPHYPEHHESPYIMPYNMEYTIPAHTMHGAEVSASDLYALHVSSPHDLGHSAVGAESSLSHAIDIQNATQPQVQMMAAMPGSVPKVKREDSQWSGVKRKPLLYNYLTPKAPVYVYRKM